MIQDTIVVSVLDNGYLVLTANHHTKQSKHNYCPNEAAVAEEVFTNLEAIRKEGGRMTTAEFEAMAAQPAPTVEGKSE